MYTYYLPKAYIICVWLLFKFNLIFSQSNFTFHPPSTPKPHWGPTMGEVMHDVMMSLWLQNGSHPEGPGRFVFFPPCPSNSATQSSFLSFREVMGSVLAS